jgi:hypothetical protein
MVLMHNISIMPQNSPPKGIKEELESFLSDIKDKINSLNSYLFLRPFFR